MFLSGARGMKLTFALIAALSIAACSKNADNLNGGVAGAGVAAPGSQQDFAENVGDRVFFDTDSTELSATAQATLDKQARWLSQYPRYAFTIEGHADERGTREYNFALGARRAAGDQELSHCARHFGLSDEDDQLWQGAPRGNLRRYFVLVAEPPCRDRAQQRQFLIGRTGAPPAPAEMRSASAAAPPRSHQILAGWRLYGKSGPTTKDPLANVALFLVAQADDRTRPVAVVCGARRWPTCRPIFPVASIVWKKMSRAPAPMCRWRNCTIGRRPTPRLVSRRLRRRRAGCRRPRRARRSAREPDADAQRADRADAVRHPPSGRSAPQIPAGRRFPFPGQWTRRRAGRAAAGRTAP